MFLSSAKDAGFPAHKFLLQEIQDLKLTSKKYFVCDNLSSNIELRNYLSKNTTKFQIAQRSLDTVILLEDKTQIIFPNTDYKALNSFIADKPAIFTHELSVKTAEFHTTLELKKISTGEILAFGVAPKTSGSMYDELKIRNESYYSHKYFSGNKVIPANTKNPHFNKGSISVAFPLVETEAEEVKKYVQATLEELNSIPRAYDILGIRGINCADFANDVINHISIPGKIIDYYKIDELDYRDQGILYLLWSDIGTFRYLKEMPYDIIDILSNIIFKKSFSHTLENALSKLGIYKIFEHPHSPLIPAAYKNDVSQIYKNLELLDKTNHSGDSPLHIALEYGNLEFALACIEEGSDINAQNDRGLTPLHYAASLPASKNKYKILTKIAEKVIDINDQDSVDHSIPLTKAVIANDVEAVSTLLNYGANPSYINSNKDSLANIALNNKAYDVINLLAQKDTDILFHDNLEHQIPICEIATISEPNSVLSNFETLWNEFDQSLCKPLNQVHAIIEL